MAVPRPAVWEVPDLKDERRYFQPFLGRWDHISARFQRALTSFPYNVWERGKHEQRLRNKVRFNDHTNWDAHAFLGSGSFGHAVLWVKRDQLGAVQDELVVKEVKDAANGRHVYLRYSEPGAGPFRGVRTEAVLQKQLNEYQCENVLHLRGYSYISNVHIPRAPGVAGQPLPNNDVGIHRFYLEYAPYHTLQQLIERYRAWDDFIPEPFLWHIFDSLAAALQTLAKGPDRKFSSTGMARRTVKFWPPDHDVVHFDIKPDNIYLGYEDWKDHSKDETGGSALFGWPVIKLADFGQSDITGPSDLDPVTGANLNVGKNWWKGASQYQAPENAFLGVDWVAPFNHVPRPNQFATRQGFINAEVQNPGFHYGSHTDVFNVGHIMYDLMTLSRPLHLKQVFDNDFSEINYGIVLGRQLVETRQWRRRTFAMAMSGNCQNLPDVDIGPQHYSEKLINLIFHCLRPSIKLRIGVDELRRQTQTVLAGYERAAMVNPPARAHRKPLRRAKRTAIAQNNPVIASNARYRIRHFNAAGLGPHRYRFFQEDYKNLMSRLNLDNDEPDLQLPPAKWRVLQASQGDPLWAFPPLYNVVHGRIWFGVRPPPVLPPHVFPAPVLPLPVLQPPLPPAGGGPGVGGPGGGGGGQGGPPGPGGGGGGPPGGGILPLPPGPLVPLPPPPNRNNYNPGRRSA